MPTTVGVRRGGNMKEVRGRIVLEGQGGSCILAGASDEPSQQSRLC